MSEAENTDASEDSKTQRGPAIYSIKLRTLMDMFDEGAFEEVLQCIQDLDTYDGTQVAKLSPKLAEVLLGIREQVASLPKDIEQSVAANQADFLIEKMNELHWNMNQTRILIDLVTLKSKSVDGLTESDSQELTTLEDGRPLRDTLFNAEMKIGEGLVDESRWGTITTKRESGAVIVSWHGEELGEEELVPQIASELSDLQEGDEFEADVLCRDVDDEYVCIGLANCTKISIQEETAKIQEFWDSAEPAGEDELPTIGWDEF